MNISLSNATPDEFYEPKETPVMANKSSVKALDDGYDMFCYNHGLDTATPVDEAYDALAESKSATLYLDRYVTARKRAVRAEMEAAKADANNAAQEKAPSMAIGA